MKRLLLLLLFLSNVHGKICLNMIVKNESHVICRCLDSVKPIIDYWVIVDTGSTDGTQEIIKSHMKGIPGELHERPWKNFGENRQEALVLAKGDYVFIMDADDYLEYEEGFQLPELKEEAYFLWRKKKGEASWVMPHLIKRSLPWKWEGVVHERVGLEKPLKYVSLEKVSYICGDDGASHSDPEKTQKYIRMLEDGLKKEPNNARYAYYLADNYDMAGNKKRALEWFTKCSQMKHAEEEQVYWSLFHICQLKRELGYDKSAVLESFKKAYDYQPHRKETICFLAEYLNLQGEYQKAYDCVKEAMKVPTKKNIFFHLDWVDDYGLLYQLFIAAKELGKMGEAEEAYHRLLKIPTLPKEFRNAVQPKICLNMIVKNESHVIQRCFDSIKDLISYWVIVDTGSTDGTEEVIQQYMREKGIPGELYRRPWKNFGENRQEALDLAKNKGDYFLIMDADDYLEYEEGFVLPYLTKDYYRMCRGYKGCLTFFMPQLVKATLPLKWVGVLHEYLSCDCPHTEENLQKILYVDTGQGARSKSPDKYMKDALVLEEGLKKEPKNERYAFYLAQSYRCAGEKGKALEWYQKRITMGGWDEETFWSLLQVGELMKDMGFATNVVIESYKTAHNFRSHRKEPLYYISELYNQQREFQKAYDVLKEAFALPARKDLNFVLDWIEEWGLLAQFSIAAYWVGKYQESLDACDSLLAMKQLPDNWREATLKNREFSLEKLGKKKSA